MSKPRYDRGAAALRTRALVPAPSAPATTTAAAPPAAPIPSQNPTLPAPGATNKAPAGGEYISLSVWLIEPAPWQPRRVFPGLEELAATIEGTPETEGVGVLEPVLVRPMPGGTYQLIDGERRLRACRLIAERAPNRDFELPARVLCVSERVARLMGQTANLEREEPRPVEVALGYQAIQEALRQELGPREASLRSLEGLGWHKKSQIGDYLQIAAMLTDGATVAAAGLLGESGEPDYAKLCRLDKNEIFKIAKMEDPQRRAVALKARVDAHDGVAARRPKSTPTAVAACSPEERRAQITGAVGFALKVKAPCQMLDPQEADALLRNELSPAILAMTERARGGAGRDGFFATSGNDHLVLALPAEVESLTSAQLERLAAVLAGVRRRVDRSLRHRRGKGSGKRTAA